MSPSPRSGEALDKRYPRCYRALKRYGFSAAYAVRILLDVKRSPADRDAGARIVLRLAVKKR